MSEISPVSKLPYRGPWLLWWVLSDLKAWLTNMPNKAVRPSSAKKPAAYFDFDMH